MTERNAADGLDFEALRQSIERCDLDLMLGFYAEDAKLSIVNAGTPHASPLIGFLINVAILALAFSLWEEIGMRGYLLPKLLSLGRTRALVIVGLVHAAWHTPLIFLTPLYHTGGNRLIVLPLFVGTVVAASFFYGYLRIYTGSVWPASIAHAVHNAAWGTLAAFTLTSNPVMVNECLAGDNGILILVTTALGAVLVGRMLRRGMNKAQRGGTAPEGMATPAATAAK